MKNFKIKKLNNVYCKASTDHPTVLNDLIKHMSVYAQNYRFMPKYKAGLWDGKIRFVENTGIFPIGLLSHVYNFLGGKDLNIEIDESLTNINENFEDEFNFLTSTWLDEKITPRDYQLEGAIKAIKYKRGILEHATSAGKSLTISLIIQYLLLSQQSKKVLILVPSVSLVEQMNSDFISYGISENNIGKYYEKEKVTDRLITISTWQSMSSKLNLIEEFDTIIMDECHMQKANVVRSIGMNASKAEHRIGTSGTVGELPKADKLLIEGVCGPIIHRIPPGYLIEHGYASDVNIKVLYLNHNEEYIRQLKGMPFNDEISWIEQFTPRNKVIKKLVHKHVEKEHNVLILVNHIEHGQAIYDELKIMSEKIKMEVFYVNGDTPANKREEIRQYVNKNKNCVIIGTYGVFSTGVSINRLHSIIFAISGKSMVRVMQSIGRGMRLHNEKNGVIIYDICDSFTYSTKHMEERISIYDKAEYKVDIMEVDFKNAG